MILAVLRYQGGDFLKPEHKGDEIFDTKPFLDKNGPMCDANNHTFYYAPNTIEAVEDLMSKVIEANKYFEYGVCSSGENRTLLSKLFF